MTKSLKNRRDVLILIGLFLVLVVFVVLGPGRQQQGDPERPTTHSSAEGGALALYTWTRALGYDSQRLEYRDFALDEDDDALVILAPSESISRAHVREMLEWVDGGGTLIFAAESGPFFNPASALLDELMVDVAVYSTTATIERAPPSQPVLDQPPTGEALYRSGHMLVPQRDDYVRIAGAGDALVVAGIKHGSGYIYLSATAYPLTNQGLRDSENAALALNLLRRLPPGGRIQFDEYHHGFFEPPSTGATVLSSPWGWAIVYAAAVVALYLILSGRRFGRPVPLPEEVVRRSSAEYVESMADLFQRGGKRGYILGHYRAAFKRRLARPYGINPGLEDAEFVRELARARAVDEPGLLALLARLRAGQIDEAALLRTVAEADAALAELARSR